MTTVTVSPKYQVVIPQEARDALGIQPGQKIQLVVYEGRVEFMPVRKLSKMCGFLRGIDAKVPRDRDRVRMSRRCITLQMLNCGRSGRALDRKRYFQARVRCQIE